MEPVWLPYGQLAPDFALQDANGRDFSRQQFRGRSGLVLLFIPPAPDLPLLADMARDSGEYIELNARVVLIVHTAPENLKQAAKWGEFPFIVLADPDGIAWKAYTGLENPGYGVFILDTYGGVDEQQVSGSPDAFPGAEKILEWTRGTQYRCSV